MGTLFLNRSFLTLVYFWRLVANKLAWAGSDALEPSRPEMDWQLHF
jgi:hypothetical protein